MTPAQPPHSDSYRGSYTSWSVQPDVRVKGRWLWSAYGPGGGTHSSAGSEEEARRFAMAEADRLKRVGSNGRLSYGAGF